MADEFPADRFWESVLALPELHDVAADAAESGLDALIDNDAVDAIPIVRTLRAIARGVMLWRDSFLTQKLVQVLLGVGEVTEADRDRWRKRLENESDVGETAQRVVAVVDRVTALIKARLIGDLLRSYLNADCNRTTFLRGVEMIDLALTEDVASLAENGPNGLPEEVIQRLVSVGLMLDRSANLVTEGSLPPEASPEALALWVAVADRRRNETA